MPRNPTNRPPRFAFALLVAGLAAASAAGGCDCQGGPVGGVGGKIVVTPASVTFAAVAVNTEADQVVTIKNDGNAALTLKAVPKLTEGTEDALTELALRNVLDPVDCATGATRNTKDAKILAPGECDTLTVVYVPQNVGADTGTVVIKSDDKNHGEVDVPIDATGAAPQIEVCLLPGDCVSQKTCNQPGQPLSLTFPLTKLAATSTCDVSVSNAGGLTLGNVSWAFKSGNRYKDYTLDPTDLAPNGEIQAGGSVTAHVHFSPKAGGDKTGLLEVTSNDPNQSVVDIQIDGKGDGPKLCPDPFPVVDFGQVDIGTTATKNVTLTNCGTMDMSITKLEVQNSVGTGPSAQFALDASAPTPPIPLSAAQATTVPVTFTPDSEATFNGRLYLESTDPVVPSGWVSLTGEGVTPPSCELQASSTKVDFGTSAPGFPVKKTIAVSNPGQLDCTGVTAQITAGASVSFSITNGLPAAPWTLKPGDIVLLEVTYDPADSTPPDTGTLELGANEVATPIDVALNGAPSATPTCALDVTPAAAGTFNLSGCGVMNPSPRVGEYGAVRVNQTKSLSATLTNVGTLPCHITWVKMVAALPFSLPDPTFALTTGAATVTVNGAQTDTINPGETGAVTVAFTPTKQVLDCGDVMIQTDDPTTDGSECGGFANTSPDPGCYQVFLQGQGELSDIEVIPGDVDFGVITVGCASQQRKVTIYNTGQASMNITDIYLAPPGKGQTPTGPFSITSMPPLPVALAGGAQLTIDLKYRPPDTSSHNAQLVIESDAQNASILTVPLTGQGTNESHQTDTFQQLAQPEVDVLFMVDDSCSMTDKQKNLAAQAQTFLQTAVSLSTDYHVGVITTDMDNTAESGKLQSRNGAPKIITPATTDPVTAFQNDVQLGTFGSGIEQGLAAIHAALTPPLVNDPATNGGFLRDPAKLVVVAVSDEDDQSSGTVDFYVDFLKNIKGYRNADMMTLSSVVGYDETTGQPHDCATGKGGVAVAAPRWVEVANRTNGICRSICSTDWGGIANDLGLNTFGAQRQFFLTREAVASSIVVHVDGTLVSQPAWSFDTPSNSITFDQADVPAQGATITVDYDTVCH